MRFRQKSQNVDTVDVSPLIDMVFILLIFFMVTTTFVKDMSLELQRPSAASSTLASTKTLRVYIDSSNEIYVDNQSVKLWALQSKLRDLLRTASEKSLLIITDTNIAVGILIDVVDECRQSGAKDVAVSTTKEMG